MIPVVVEEGVTSLSTLTHVFTVTSTVSLTSLASTASALPFLDRDTELSSGESVSREAFLPFHNQLHTADKDEDTDPLSFPDLDSSFVLTPAPQLVAAPAHTPQLQLVSSLQPAPEPPQLQLPGLPVASSPDQLQLPGLPLAASPDQLQLPGLPLAASPDQLANLPALASLSPEQLSYLQLLRQQIPGLPLASFGPQVVSSIHIFNEN